MKKEVQTWVAYSRIQCENFKTFMRFRFYVKSNLIILSPKNYHFDHFSSSEFWIVFEDFWHFQVCNFSKNQNSTPLKLLKQQFLTSWNQLKLISRKIRVAGNVYSEKSQLGCPGLYMLEKCEMFSAKKKDTKRSEHFYSTYSKWEKQVVAMFTFFPWVVLNKKKGTATTTTNSPQQCWTLHSVKIWKYYSNLYL